MELEKTPVYQYEVYRDTAGGMWWISIFVNGEKVPNIYECAYTKWGAKSLAKSYIKNHYISPKRNERYTYGG